MAMTILNNTGTMMSLGELNKNITEVGKQLAKIASGQRIVGARDGASDFAISEKMRVKLRAMGQDDRNVRAGSSLLQLAEGSIQEQIRLMRTIKERVINASNDSNTDADRAIIQKEIDQYYRQIEDIAIETEFNGKKLLMDGNRLSGESFFWKRISTTLMDDEELNIIPDVFPTLDGVVGPFDRFHEVGESTPSTIPSLRLDSTQNLENGKDGEPYSFVIDLGKYASVDDLVNVGFTVGGENYVFTRNLLSNYAGHIDHRILLEDGDTLSDVAAKVPAARRTTVEASGERITFRTKEMSASAHVDAAGLELPGDMVVIVPPTPDYAPSPTGLFSDSPHLEGGQDYSGVPAPPDDPDYKGSYTPGEAASLSRSVAEAPDGSGITIHAGDYTYCIQFVEGDMGITTVEGIDKADNTEYYIVGKEATASLYLEPYDSYPLRFRLSDGTMTVEALLEGSYANEFGVTDGIDRIEGSSGGPAYINAMDALRDDAIGEFTEGADGAQAYYDINLSDYMVSDTGTLEAFISDLSGKTLTYTNHVTYPVSSTTSRLFSFVDMAYELPLDKRVFTSGVFDLDELRSRVTGMTTIAEAFAEMVKERAGDDVEILSGTGGVNGLRFIASEASAIGNDNTLAVTEGTWLRHYDIDYGAYFETYPVDDMPEFLDGKGFRFYCATHTGQWFNVVFVNGSGAKDKPLSGTDDEDIKTLVVDVSGVTDAGSLVQAIYDQAGTLLSSSDPEFDHYMRMTGNVRTGLLRIYDWRAYPVNSSYYDYQDMGAKIADGVSDNYDLMYGFLYVNDLIIQHTDKQNQNIRIQLPRTTLDQIFGLDHEKGETINDLNVLTKDSRENLLGIKDYSGRLDRGIEYLLGANTLVGAQMARLAHAGENIATQNENLTASESVIRDADMAKEMLAFTKSQILSQGSQGMLAQANQNAASVLGLLQ